MFGPMFWIKDFLSNRLIFGKLLDSVKKNGSSLQSTMIDPFA